VVGLGPQEGLELQAQLDLLALLVPLDREDLMAHQVALEPLVDKVPQGRQVLQVLEANKVPLALEEQELLAL